MNEPKEQTARPDGPARGVSRREFLAAGAGALSLPLLEPCCSPAHAALKQGGHHVPADKNLSREWVEALYAKGEPKTYRGDELTCIGMPIGGLCAGQLYIRGDGTLAGWEIFNHHRDSGYGDTSYRTYTPSSPVRNEFALEVHEADKPPRTLVLDRSHFPDVSFVGEYPIATVRYGQPAGEPIPVEVTLEAFSPFIPLEARDSATPGTILRYMLRNRSDRPVDVSLSGTLANVVCAQQAGRIRGEGRNTIVRGEGLTTLLLTAEQTPVQPPTEMRPPETFADFEGEGYGDWKTTGTAFGTGPAHGTLPNQQPVSGFGGKGLVNSYVQGDASTGSLRSPEFTIKRPYIRFKIGGGNQPEKACINLIVNGIVTRTATGKNREQLEPDYWDVSEFQDAKAHLEIIDQAKAGWGHVNVDDIQFADTPPPGVKARRLNEQEDFGTLGLSVLDDQAKAWTNASEGTGSNVSVESPHTFPLGRNHPGRVSTQIHLEPGQSKEVVFLVTWHFDRNEHGHAYAEWFHDAVHVAQHLQKHLDRLTKQTRLFHQTYYDSTLPHWLLDRLLMPFSTLATNTCQWWRNGRFWAWEGVGCCHGTCTHVWNYAQGVARLFPELERSARVMQDLGPALDPQTGRVAFRGEGPGFPYAADGQCGTVLKCYREHLMSPDRTFLDKQWPQIKKVMEYSISRDGNADGVIEDHQHNTYDIDFVGPNTFVGALYLAALEAAARMAEIQNDAPFAERCRSIAAKGRDWTVAHLWNGEYFEQHIPKGEPTRFQYGEGCLADQLFGQNWANQVDLGDVYPHDKVRTALTSIYRYNWAPDVKAQNEAHPPQRWFARPGDAGLFTCTWPKGGRMDEPVLYRDEVWTGIEYQVAAHLLAEGMIREGLTIIRGVNDRYDGRRHNPWNEVECGDHYARALASWGCLLELCGFRYDGPAGRLGFAPRWQAADFRAFFSAAEGWGTLSQKRDENSQHCQAHVVHGKVTLREVTLEAPSGVTVSGLLANLGGQPLDVQWKQAGPRISVETKQPFTIGEGQALQVHLSWKKG